MQASSYLGLSDNDRGDMHGGHGNEDAGATYKAFQMSRPSSDPEGYELDSYQASSSCQVVIHSMLDSNIRSMSPERAQIPRPRHALAFDAPIGSGVLREDMRIFHVSFFYFTTLTIVNLGPNPIVETSIDLTTTVKPNSAKFDGLYLQW
jgi:hypothetical protein